MRFVRSQFQGSLFFFLVFMGLGTVPAQVSAQVQGQLGGFRIKPENIQFVGNRNFSSADLRNIFQSVGNLVETPKTEQDDLYDTRRLNLGVNALLAFYRNRGFIKATIKSPEFEYGSSATRNQVQILFNVTEDQAYSFEEIKITGGQALPPSIILGLLNISTKTVINVTKIDAGIAAVRGVYLALGYLDADVTSTLDAIPNKKVADLLVTIREGNQYHVGRIQFGGIPAIRESLLREFLPLQSGDIFGEKSFHAALESLNSLGPPHTLTSTDIDFHIDQNQAIVDLTIYLEGKNKKGETGKTKN
jgi:outer membrane protein assembly factor BamA